MKNAGSQATYFDTFIDAFSRLPIEERILDGDFVLCPPEEDFGYQSTPVNAVIFSRMGVDGVHDAILKIDGLIRDDSPVVQVSPMDSNDVFVIAESFLEYLAKGCDLSPPEMEKIFKQQRSASTGLVPFLMANFQSLRLLAEENLARLASKCSHMLR